MWWKKREQFPYREGFEQALAVAFYVGLVIWFMSNAQNWFGKLDQTTGPLLFLTIFVVSVMVCGLLVFAKPYKLFLAKKGERALNLVLATAKWLVLFALGVIVRLWMR